MNLTLCREDGLYEAGGPLTARWRISRVPLEEVYGVEVSVLWHTEGKGDEDFHVHHFHRLSENQIRRVGLADGQSTRCQLPPTPLSYHGRLISVRWCVRLRLFLANGKEIVAEQPFHLVHPQMLAPSLEATNDGMRHASGAEASLPTGVAIPHDEKAAKAEMTPQNTDTTLAPTTSTIDSPSWPRRMFHLSRRGFARRSSKS